MASSDTNGGFWGNLILGAISLPFRAIEKVGDFRAALSAKKKGGGAGKV